MKKRIFSLFLSIFFIIPFVCFPVNAASDHVYYSQFNWKDKNGNKLGSMCYFTSFAMIVTNLGKRVTPVDVYYANGSMCCDFNILSKRYGLNFTEVSLYTYATESEKRQKIITALESGKYPAGILVCGRTSGSNHMVVARKVVNGVIYCDDPARGCCIPIDNTERVSKNITSYKAFTKGGTWGANNANTPVVQTPALSSVKTAGAWYITVPANYKLLCYSSDTAMTSNGVYVRPQSSSYHITCTQKSELSNGITRYYGTFNTDDYYWFVYTNKMSAEDRSKPQTYTVTFNAGDGTVSPSSKTYTAGDTYGTLPIPTCPGYVFKGWLAIPGYTYATPSTTVPDSITLFARWEEETPHTHQKGNVSTCENEHPHRNFYICSTCGEQFTDGSTNYVDSCKICNPNDSNNPLDSLASLGQDAINAVTPPHTEHSKDNRIVSSAHPHYVFYTCNVCGEVYTDDSTEAVSTCEECWGPWSKWTSKSVKASATRQVETRKVKISDGYTEYRYGRYIDSTGKNNCWCAKYLESLSYVSGKATLQYSKWSKTRYNANSKGWTCGFCNGKHIGVDKVGADGRSWWAEYELPGGDFYWEESRKVGAQYETQYRYRDLGRG